VDSKDLFYSSLFEPVVWQSQLKLFSVILLNQFLSNINSAKIMKMYFMADQNKKCVVPSLFYHTFSCLSFTFLVKEK